MQQPVDPMPCSCSRRDRKRPRSWPLVVLSLSALLSSSQAAALEFKMLDAGLIDEGFAEQVRTETGAARSFIQLTAFGMAEQSFTLQHASSTTSTLSGAQTGLGVGLQLVTFPFVAQENLLGKEENTGFSPVLPRFTLGMQKERDGWLFSVGGSAVPPISVQGGGAFVVGADVALARRLEGGLRIGLELESSVGQAVAPVTVPKAAYEEAQTSGSDDFANVDPVRYDEVCAPQTYGCLDTLTFKHGSARLVVSKTLGKTWSPYFGVGVQGISERFDVQVDLSSYALSGVMPQVGLGTGLQLPAGVVGKVGALVAWAGSPSFPDGGTLLYRLELGASYGF